MERRDTATLLVIAKTSRAASREAAGVGIDGQRQVDRPESDPLSGLRPRTERTCGGRRSGCGTVCLEGRASSTRAIGAVPVDQPIATGNDPLLGPSTTRIPYRPMASTTEGEARGQSGVSGRGCDHFRENEDGVYTVAHLRAGLPDETMTDAQPSATACGNWQTVRGVAGFGRRAGYPRPCPSVRVRSRRRPTRGR